MTREQAAKELVDRARCGDQNAMAMIAMVGKNARNGNEQARQAYQYLQDYIRDNPVKADLGAEQTELLGVLKAADENPLQCTVNALCMLPQVGDGSLIRSACVVLSQCKPWNKQRIKAVDAGFEGAAQNLFRFGFATLESRKLQPIAAKLDKKQMGIVCCGHCIGVARKFQLSRLNQVPVSVLSPEIGWELGC